MPSMKKAKVLFPFAMTILGGLAIGSLTVLRMTHDPASSGAALWLAAIVMYGAWKIWESHFSVDELQQAETNRDKGTVELCAAVEIALLISLLLNGNEIQPELAIGGLTIMGVGIHIRVFSIRALGDNYSLRIRRLKTRPVCTGPYSAVRHPAYLGTLICHTGIVMVFANGYSFLILAVWYAAVLVRTLVEDRVLMEDSEYRKYAQRVRWRLIPGII